MRFVGLLALSALALGFASVAEAHERFDGAWAIYIFGDPGPCEFGYRLPISIKQGAIYYQGRTVSPYAIGLNDTGAVAIRLEGGSYVVTGTGALHGGYGKGTWKAAALRCAGRWRAERQ